MRLIIVRHAKSSWNQPNLDDHDRPLAPRGQRSTGLIGNWLASRQFLPQQVICSTARRARETWLGIAGHLPEPEAVQYRDRLYHAHPVGIARIAAAAELSPVMIVGHNPGFGDLARFLCGNQCNHPEFGRYPTAATLVCDIDNLDLASLVPGTATLVDFTVPRDLDQRPDPSG